MSCSNNCKICDRAIISTAVTVVTVDGVDTLVIDLPVGTYFNQSKYCIIVAQTIPTTATINMPVAFSIGGDTTTVYPFVRCDCAQITACGIRTRTRYPVLVSTSVSSGVFKSLMKLNCYPATVLASLPVPTTTTTLNEPAVAEAVAPTPVYAPTTAKTTKTTTSKEAK